MDSKPEVTSAEAAQKTKEAAEALQKAQAEQIEHSNRASEERITSAFTVALKKAFSTDEIDGQKRFIDITRIPLICQNINQMHEDIASIKDNLKWGVRVVIGAVLLAGVTMVLK